jgi:hypothetical protein
VRKLVLSAIQGVCGYVRENEAEFVAKIREESMIQQQEAAINIGDTPYPGMFLVK